MVSTSSQLLEVVVLGDHVQVNEEVASGDQFFRASSEPAIFIADGVDGKGDEVEHHQQIGQTIFVSEVVFEVVFVVLEFVEGFVFDFPLTFLRS